MQDVQQQLKSQEQQFLKQEQQFLRIDERLVQHEQQQQQLLSINGKFDQLINVLSTKQPSTQPSEDLKTMIKQVLKKQPVIYFFSE